MVSGGFITTPLNTCREEFGRISVLMLGQLGLVLLAGIFTLGLLAPAGALAAECTNTWVGPAESTWQTAANWSTGKVPSETDVACIGSGKTAKVTAGTNQAGTVQAEGTVAISGGTLKLVTSPSEEISSIKTMTMSAGGWLSGPGSVNVTSTLSWTGEANMSGTGTTTIASGATATINFAVGSANVKGRHLVNEGTLTLTAGRLIASESGKVTNLGTFNVNSQTAKAVSAESGGKFSNSGTLQKISGTETTEFTAGIQNEGVVYAQTGKLFFAGGGTSGTSSQWKASEGSEVKFSKGTFLLNQGTLTNKIAIGTEGTVQAEGTEAKAAQVDNAGMFRVEGAPTSVGTLTMLSGGSWIDGAGTLTVTKALNWTASSTMTGTGSTVLASGVTATVNAPTSGAFIRHRLFINEGTITLSGGRLTQAEGGEIRNSGTFNANSETTNAIASEAVPGLFINTGLFRKTSGTGTTTVVPGFANYGVIKEETGKLKFEKPVGVPSSSHLNHRSSCGDPVECASGNFSETQTDLVIGGRGVGLYLNRTYNAQAAATAGAPGAFGYGWTNSFGDALISEEGGKKITAVMADGGKVLFTESGKGSFSAPSWSQDTLSGSAEAGYTLTLPNQTKYVFSGSGKLESVADRNGNATSLGYNKSGQLETITDPAGRKITLAYNGEGLVESAKDPMGYTAKYTYESKNLKTVTEPGEASATWQFKYDGSHRMTSMTDGRGGKTTNEYDGSSRVISQIDPGEHKMTFEYAPFHTKVTNKATGAVTDQWFTSNNQPYSITRGFGTGSATTETFAYNSAGQLLSKTDGNGHKTSYSYDGQGNRTSEKTAIGTETKWSYNGVNDVLTETTPNGEETTIMRDVNGNPETISRPAPGEETQVTAYTYDLHGQLESVTDPLEHTWTFEYDSQGNRKTEIDPEGDKRTWAYDEDSRLTSVVSARGNEEGAEPAKYMTSIERDARGRPIKVTDPLEGIAKYAYDANGSLESETDPNNHKTKYSYNAENEQTKIEKPNGNVLETTYDGAGQVSSQIDGNKNKTTFVRNILGQPIEVIDPLSRKSIREYDAAGNLKSVTDPLSRKTSYSFDDANRLKQVSYSDGVTPTATFDYDEDGNLTSMIDGSGESSYEYDQLGRLSKSINGHGDTVQYEYNLGNQQTEITYPNGKTLVQAFDSAGRLEAVTDWLGGTTSFAYNRNSSPRTVAFPEGTGNVDEYSYDRADRISAITIKKGVETIASLNYPRDKMGQLESQTSTGLPGSPEESFTYDVNSRLSKAGVASYEYDAANNPTKVAGSTNTYDKASQLEASTGFTYTYNEDSERTKRTPSSGPITNYKYDQAGNLTAVERSSEGETPAISESYSYDGSRLRASQTVSASTRHLTWNATTSLPLLLSDDQNSYIYGPGGVVIEQISSEEEPTYVHRDQLGSTRVLTSASGNTTGTFTYGVYGGVAGSTGSQTTPIGYAGQYTDSQSGLQYLRARYYDPSTAQFLSRDPLTVLTREPFMYGKANPLAYVDPSGMGPCVFGFIACDESDDPCDSIATGPLLPACLFPEEWEEPVTDFVGGAGDELLSPPGSGLGPIPDIEPGPWLREQLNIGNVDTCSTAYGAGRGTALAASLVRGLASGAGYVGKYGPKVKDGLRSASRGLDEKFVHVPLP